MKLSLQKTSYMKTADKPVILRFLPLPSPTGPHEKVLTRTMTSNTIIKLNIVLEIV